MAVLRQNFEGMANAAIPSGAYGYNHAPDAIQITSGATVEAHSDAAYSGTRGMRARLGANTGGAAFIWSTQRALITEAFSRFYFMADAIPNLTIGVQRYYSAALAGMGGINYSGLAGTPGVFALSTPAGSTDTIGSVVCPAGQWCRLEVRHFADTVNGMITLRVYLNPSAHIDDYDEELNYGSVKAMPTNQSKRVDYGIAGSGNNAPNTDTSDYINFDSFVDSETAWVGGEEQVLRPDSDVSAGSWTTAPLYDALDDDSDATLITGVAS